MFFNCCSRLGKGEGGEELFVTKPWVFTIGGCCFGGCCDKGCDCDGGLRYYGVLDCCSNADQIQRQNHQLVFVFELVELVELVVDADADVDVDADDAVVVVVVVVAQLVWGVMVVTLLTPWVVMVVVMVGIVVGNSAPYCVPMLEEMKSMSSMLLLLVVLLLLSSSCSSVSLSVWLPQLYGLWLECIQQ